MASLDRGDPGMGARIEQVQRHRATGKHLVMEGTNIEFRVASVRSPCSPLQHGTYRKH